MNSLSLELLAEYSGSGDGWQSTVDKICIVVTAGAAVYTIIAVATSWNPIGWVVGGTAAACGLWGIGRAIEYFVSE